MAFVTNPVIGVDLTQTDTTPQFPLGMLVNVDGGAVYQYVQAMSIHAQYNAVLITTSSKSYNALTALGVSVKAVGFAQVSIGLSAYGWVARMGGNIRVKCAANCAAGVQLYTTATEGVLDDAIVTAALVVGVVTLTSISTATNTDIVAGTPAVLVAAAPGA